MYVIFYEVQGELEILRGISDMIITFKARLYAERYLESNHTGKSALDNVRIVRISEKSNFGEANQQC